jgi:hypothetical protein
LPATTLERQELPHPVIPGPQPKRLGWVEKRHSPFARACNTYPLKAVIYYLLLLRR